jgi:hypothetical protein
MTDVACLFHDGQYFCTEFYIKLKLTRLKRPFELNGFEQSAIENELFRTTLQDLGVKCNCIVDIFCNGIRINVLAISNADGIVQFYDFSTRSFSDTPNTSLLLSFNLVSQSNSILCRHRGSAASKSFTIWMLDLNKKIVVMDIDGTITKSDVRGYMETVYRLV